MFHISAYPNVQTLTSHTKIQYNKECYGGGNTVIQNSTHSHSIPSTQRIISLCFIIRCKVIFTSDFQLMVSVKVGFVGFLGKNVLKELLSFALLEGMSQ